MKVITVIGARPQFIKAALISKIFKEWSIHEIVAHTGQHYDHKMSDIFFEELEMDPPQHNLGIGSKSHGAQTGEMLIGLEKIVQAEKPDVLLVYGDTNSTLAGALVASKLNIPVAHVEAGLRSYNMNMPEEVNRILTDHVSSILFAPTLSAEANLKAEGFSADKVVLVGDVMFDAALHAEKKALKVSSVLTNNRLKPQEYILSTVHRAENTDDKNRLLAIFEGLNDVGAKIPVVLPLHPRTKSKLSAHEINQTEFSNLIIIEPLGF